jgi:hypothetical protein
MQEEDVTRITVYVAGPLSQGDIPTNVARAMQVGKFLMQRGFFVFIPHLTYFLDPTSDMGYHLWLDQDFYWLDSCEAVLRLPGFSPGAVQEDIRARRKGKKVFYSVDALLNHYEDPEWDEIYDLSFWKHRWAK